VTSSSPDGVTVTVNGVLATTTHTDTAYNLTVHHTHTYYVLAAPHPYSYTTVRTT